MSGKGSGGNKIGCGGVLLVLGAPGAILLGFILFVVVVFAAASAPFGWLFGGGEPSGQPSANQPPQGAPHYWTPTPIPSECFITPTPVAITVAPPTPNPNQLTPANTPANVTPGVTYLPTATPCSMTFLPTPDPNFPPVGVSPQGNYDIRQGKITLAKVQQILLKWPNENGSPNPLTPFAQRVLDFQEQYGINGGFSLAWFAMESGICTTGISPSAIECGNIRWTEGGNCVTHNYDSDGRDFCGYANWSDAIEAWFKLLKGYYIANGLTTVSAIVHVYAPCSDQKGGCAFVNHYIATVNELANEWGFAQAVDPSSLDNSSPHGSPFKTGPGGYWVTQAYGCTDFEEWYSVECKAATGGKAVFFHRGIDVVSKGDPTIFATMDGTVTYAGWMGGFGNAIYVSQGPYVVIYPHESVLYAHLGQQVKWGEPIGRQGSTGYSTGDHVHYEIHINGAWVDSTPFLQKP